MKNTLIILIALINTSIISCTQEKNKTNFVVDWTFIKSDTMFYQPGKIKQINYITSPLDENDIVIKDNKDLSELFNKQDVLKFAFGAKKSIELRFDSTGTPTNIDYFSGKVLVDTVYGELSISHINQLDSSSTIK
tara:strand:+ start:55 stop:459 length:405 start_codon:yes stop_codon:yes gene_type:complete